jgi:hypothetical protein
VPEKVYWGFFRAEGSTLAYVSPRSQEDELPGSNFESVVRFQELKSDKQDLSK